MTTRPALFSLMLLPVALLTLATPVLADCQEGPPDTFTCDTDAPNPDLTGIQQETNDNNLTIVIGPGARINTTAAGTDAVRTGNGDNSATVTDAEVIALDRNGITLGDGNDVMTVTRSTVQCEDDCLQVEGGTNQLTVTDSMVQSFDNNGIDGGDGVDTILVEGSQIIADASGDNFAIWSFAGDDSVTIRNSYLAGTTSAIILDDGDDVLRLETGASIDGIIDCGDRTDDTELGTIIFAMEVPESQLPQLQTEIATADPEGDSLTIQGETYTWVDCSALVDELVPTENVLEVPVLSSTATAFFVLLLAGLGLAWSVRT